jgi:hypothetical protein
MAQLTFEIPGSLVSDYRQLSPRQQAQVQLWLATAITRARGQQGSKEQAAGDLFEAMDRLQREAEAKGLTDEALQSLLNERK